MKKINYLMTLLLLISIASMNAQVRIGSQADPHQGAVLDLKSNETATKGLLLPNVSLSDVNTFQLATNSAESEGMIVYNTNKTIGEGIYVWDGENWTTSSPDDVVYNEDGSIATQIGENIYGTYLYGDDIWMVWNSKEGNSSAQMYDNDPTKVNGYYYTFAQATSACPSGWHLPSAAEWTKLINEVMAENASGACYWLSKDCDAFAGGFETGKYSGFGAVGVWWCDNGQTAVKIGPTPLTLTSNNISGLTSIRCVQDK